MTGVILKTIGTVLLATCCMAAHAKIKEKDLTVLTLHAGKYTTARRTSPIPQLRCDSNCKHAPQSVQCKATGWDGEKLHWKCDAMLPEGVTFGAADVSCEGYDYPGDPYITAGSCGLSYSLVGRAAGGGGYSGGGGGYQPDEGGSGKMPLLLMGVVFVVLLVKWCNSGPSNNAYDRQPSDDDDSNQGRRFYGGSGGGGFGDNTTPGFRPNYYSSTGAGCGGNQQQAPGAGGGGFWSGLAAGALGGYMFGRNNTYDAYGYGPNQDYVRNRGFSSGFSSGFSGNSSGPSTSGTSRSTSAFASTSRR